MRHFDRFLSLPVALAAAGLSSPGWAEPAGRDAQRIVIEAPAARLATGDVLALAQPAAAFRMSDGQVLSLRAVGALLRGRHGGERFDLRPTGDGVYEREVALKLPRVRAGAGAQALAARFAGEMRIAARLEHPHIARLYDAGVDALGRPYLVMEHVRGAPILAWCAERAATRTQRLALVLQACAAVAHAHAALVVHRDLKPSNLMVDDAGQVKLLDFGIARLLAHADDAAPGTRLTQTPAYAAPEQLRGQPLGTACDQYALAVVAHELLTGRRPERPGDGNDAVVDPELGRDLGRVLARALRDNPARRHSSVERMADELQRVREQRPLRDDPGPWLHRAALLLLRRRRVEALATGLGGAVLAVAGTLAWQAQAAQRQEAERGVQARTFMFELLEDAEPMQGQSPQDVTGAQLLRNGLERARTAFPGQPALQGDVLVQLGLMLRRYGLGAEALQALREGQALLAASAPPRDAARARADAQLAQQLVVAMPGSADEAARLAQGALAACAARGGACARARAYAHTALLELARRGGDTAAAVAQAQAAVQASAEGFGADDAETVLARLQLAVVLRNSGQPAQAAEALALATAQGGAEGPRLRRGDARTLQLWRALIQADLGQDSAALAGFAALLGDAPPAQRPLLLRLQAQSQWALGLWPQALATQDAGLAAAQALGAARELAFGRQLRARALAALGRSDEARREIDAVLAALPSLGLAADSVERLRAQRLAAEVAMHAGDLAAANALLRDLPARHGATSEAPKAPVDLAQALDLQGALARIAGRDAEAAALHAQAARLLALQLPEDHPLRRRNAVEAARAAPPGDAGDARLRDAVQRWLSALPADSGWRRALERLTADEAARRQLVM